MTVLVAVALAAMLMAVLPPTMAGDGAEPPAPRGDIGSGWIPDVLAAVSRGADVQPSLTTSSGGELYLAYQTDAAGDWDIMFKSSSDGGTTWTAPVPVANTNLDEVNPSIATDPYSGRIFVAYQNSTMAPGSIDIAFSDDGLTWTVAGIACSGLCERPRIVSEYWNGVANRQYVVFYGIGSATDADWFLYNSTDQGATWTLEHWDNPLISDVRYMPDVAVQRGTDGVDRVIVFYRGGASTTTATTGFMTWSEDHGATWAPRSQWEVRVGSPPAIAAAHDGDSVLVAFGASDNSDVIWEVDADPTDLTWGTGTSSGFFRLTGYRPQLAADGVGSASLAIGGNYHMIVHSSSAASNVLYMTAPVSLTVQGDWTRPILASDTAAVVSATYPERTVTTQLRGGTWYPAAAWGDVRGMIMDQEVRYTTPGGRWTFDTVPTGLNVTVDGTEYPTPATVAFAAGTTHSVDAPSPQSLVPGVRYVWSSWSNGGSRSQAIVAGVADGSLVATFGTEYEVAVDSDPAGRDVIVNGTTQATPASFWLPMGVYPVDVASPQSGATGWRYRFLNWSDAGLKAHDINVTGPMALLVNFTPEVLFTVNSARGGVTGGGWFNLGYYTTAVATSPQSGGTGRRYTFIGWTGDEISNSLSISVLMDAPKTVTANWRTEYNLTVTSAHGTTTGTGWYTDGTDATITVASRTVTEGGKTWEFTGWAGDATGSTVSVTIRMDGAKAVTANWRETTSILGGPLGTGLLVVIILIVALFLILAFILMRRRKKKQAPAFQQMHAESGIGMVTPSLPGQPPEPTQGPPPPPNPPA